MTWEPRLCKRNRYVEELTQQLTGVPSGTPASLSGSEPEWTGTRTLTLELTQQQFTQMFSALMTGADIIYPETAHQITWLLWEAVEYP